MTAGPLSAARALVAFRGRPLAGRYRSPLLVAAGAVAWPGRAVPGVFLARFGAVRV